MNEVLVKENVKIKNLIFEVRGKQVMLDSDLAKLYQVETKRINEAVKNNPLKFPERYSWFLTKDEINFLTYSRSKISTLNNQTIKRGQNIKYLPRVFTENGIAMLATILKSKIAIETSIAIMDAFVTMRHYISTNLLEQKYINNQVIKNTEDIKLLQESFQKFEEKKIINEIYFKGQIYDAYSKIIDIFKSAKKELIIIDGYSDKTTLDMIKNLNVKVILIVKTKPLLTNLDIKKYESQYNNLQITYSDDFHDRYFIIDKKTIYHSGTSINHAGSKTFSINILEDELIKKVLINKVETYI